jgi:hypothetical protein
MKRRQPSWDPAAERRAREVLRAVVPAEDYEMYLELGFLSVAGGGKAPSGYAYLLYPQRAIVAYDPDTDALLSEYCVGFADRDDPRAFARLPDADDVLAKWMALKASERELLETANINAPGRQVDPGQVRRDLALLREWRASRAGRRATPSAT